MQVSRLVAPRALGPLVRERRDTITIAGLHGEIEGLSFAHESERFHKGLHARFDSPSRIFDPHHQTRTRVASKHSGRHRATPPIDDPKSLSHELRDTIAAGRVGAGTAALVRPLQSPTVACWVTRLRLLAGEPRRTAVH